MTSLITSLQPPPPATTTTPPSTPQPPQQQPSSSHHQHHQHERPQGLVLLIPLVLGLGRVNPSYFPQLQRVLQWPQSLGIVGGRPGSSLYFVGHQHLQLLHLDPHTVQEVWGGVWCGGRGRRGLYVEGEEGVLLGIVCVHDFSNMFVVYVQHMFDTHIQTRTHAPMLIYTHRW